MLLAPLDPISLQEKNAATSLDDHYSSSLQAGEFTDLAIYKFLQTNEARILLTEHYVAIKYKWADPSIRSVTFPVCLLIFCVMQQLLLSLNPILSGAALGSIHLMNNGRFNPGLACSTWLWFTREEKDKYSLF